MCYLFLHHLWFLNPDGAPTVGEKAAAALAQYAKEKNGNGTGNDYAADDLVSLITNPETIGGAVDVIKEIVGSEQVNQETVKIWFEWYTDDGNLIIIFECQLYFWYTDYGNLIIIFECQSHFWYTDNGNLIIIFECLLNFWYTDDGNLIFIFECQLHFWYTNDGNVSIIFEFQLYFWYTENGNLIIIFECLLHFCYLFD